MRESSKESRLRSGSDLLDRQSLLIRNDLFAVSIDPALAALGLLYFRVTSFLNSASCKLILSRWLRPII